MSAMVALPIPIEGPILSPLQARAGESHIQFVDVAASSIVGGIAEQFLNDRDALVQEALVRVVTEWVKHDAKGAADWLAELRDPPANVRALIG